MRPASSASLQATTGLTFRPDVEGLRAIAVILVVAFHYGVAELSGGFIGVDVFFVISGFVITRMLQAEFQSRATIDLIGFYGKRARRLLPACGAMVVATLIASTMVFSPVEMKSVAKGGVASSLYFSNFWFMSQSWDYFAPESAMNPFLHTWTLSVEEQFYLIWPTILLCTLRLPRRWQILIFGLIVTASFGASAWIIRLQPAVAFYASPLRAWEFGLGALVTYSRSAKWGALAATTGLVAIGWSAVALSENSTFPGLSALSPGLGTVAILYAGGRRNLVSSGLGSPPFQWVGRLSYSIYLWHWPMIVLALAAYPDLGLTGRCACAMTTLLLAWMSFTGLEHPIRTNAWLIAKRERSIALAAALTAAAAIASSCLWGFGFLQTTRPEQREITAAANERSQLPGDCLLYFTVAQPKACSFLKGREALVLLGDSHAAQLFTPARWVAQALGMRMVTYLKSSCPISDVEVFNNRLHRLNPECGQWRRSVFRALARLRPAVIVVSQSSMGYVKGSDRSGGTITIERPDWAQGTRRSLRYLAGTGARVFVVEDSPRMQFAVPNCLSRIAYLNLPPGTCDRPRQRVLDDQLARVEADAAIKAGVQYVTTQDLYCSRTTCAAKRDGRIVYRDGNHITEAFARSLSRPLFDKLHPLL
ncbi:acyltransferase family protein [Sphingomonas limnosediminicola]|uniref:acyltransferase family protein n=1 Tax=Sphingomonas limnosediminicola TaxID=940133 RepID=UPI003CD09E11